MTTTAANEDGSGVYSMFGSRLGFSGSADLMEQLSNFKTPRWRLTAILDIQNGHNFATGLPINVMFGSRVGFPFPAELRILLLGPIHARTAVARNRCVSWAFLS